MKVLLPNSFALSLPPEEGVTWVTFDVSAPIPEEHRDAEALVVWLDPHAAEHVAQLPHLKLIQGMMAGAESLHATNPPAGVILATANGLHDATVSEHAIALALYLVRDLRIATEEQDNHRWSRDRIFFTELRPGGRLTSLLGAQVTIWGYGHIGRHLAGMLKAFGARVRGLATSRRTEGDIEVYDGANLAQRDEVLADTDVLILILPATEATANVVDASVFAALPERAVVVNVGRGKTVKEDDLAAALREGKIAGAGLDVTATEPLPADSPLWDLATIITPHTAGGRPVGAEELILANVRALREGGEFINREA